MRRFFREFQFGDPQEVPPDVCSALRSWVRVSVNTEKGEFLLPIGDAGPVVNYTPAVQEANKTLDLLVDETPAPSLFDVHNFLVFSGPVSNPRAGEAQRCEEPPPPSEPIG